MNRYRQLILGEPAPWFQQRNTSNPSYAFDTVAGRYIVMCFFSTASDATGQAALEITRSHRDLFDDNRISFFGISTDPNDEHENRVKENIPGIRHFWDFDGKACRLYGALPTSAEEQPERLLRQWVILDPGLHVLAILPFQADGQDRVELIERLTNLPPVSHYGGMEMHAPVIILPNVFEPALCQRLIDTYERDGGEISGFMRDVDGKTVGVYDKHHKQRDDYTIEDEALRLTLASRVQKKVSPMMRKIHCFDASRMERYIVGCYDRESGGHFRPHRDNTTRGTAHRRFALSINLNSDFEGGELIFPEYGPRRYKAPPGAAIIFSGALLHAVAPVTRGRRYAFLPFLYDEAAAVLRQQNASSDKGS